MSTLAKVPHCWKSHVSAHMCSIEEDLTLLHGEQPIFNALGLGKFPKYYMFLYPIKPRHGYTRFCWLYLAAVISPHQGVGYRKQAVPLLPCHVFPEVLDNFM